MSEAIYLYRRIPFADFSTCTIERFTELSAHHMYETKIAFDGDDYDTLRTANQRLEGEVARLRANLSAAHVFIENTEAFGLAAASGVLECGGAIWNIEESKAALAGDGGDV